MAIHDPLVTTFEPHDVFLQQYLVLGFRHDRRVAPAKLVMLERRRLEEERKRADHPIEPLWRLAPFARNPMVCAYIANDLQLVSRGRFVLGLGTQIRAHVEKRFSQPWSKPNARMREFVQAIRAIWHSWETGRSPRSG